MVSLKHVSILIGSWIVLTSAAAIFAPEPVETASSIVCIYMCTDVYFNGNCENFCGSPGLCYNLPAKWNDVVSSARPKQGQDNGCTLFPDGACVGRSQLEGLHYPGYGNLLDQSFNDVASSWICY